MLPPYCALTGNYSQLCFTRLKCLLSFNLATSCAVSMPRPQEGLELHIFSCSKCHLFIYCSCSLTPLCGLCHGASLDSTFISTLHLLTRLNCLFSIRSSQNWHFLCLQLSKHIVLVPRSLCNLDCADCHFATLFTVLEYTGRRFVEQIKSPPFPFEPIKIQALSCQLLEK